VEFTDNFTVKYSPYLNLSPVLYNFDNSPKETDFFKPQLYIDKCMQYNFHL